MLRRVEADILKGIKVAPVLLSDRRIQTLSSVNLEDSVLEIPLFS